jgi:hypothetical protein
MGILLARLLEGEERRRQSCRGGKRTGIFHFFLSWGENPNCWFGEELGRFDSRGVLFWRAAGEDERMQRVGRTGALPIGRIRTWS